MRKKNTTKPKFSTTNLRLIQYLATKKLVVAFFVFITLVSAVLAMAVPYIQGLLVTVVENQNEKVFATLSCLVGGILLISGVCSLLERYLANAMSLEIIEKMRESVFDALLMKYYEYFETSQPADLMLKTNAYVNDVGKYVAESLSALLLGLFKIFAIFIFTFTISVPLSILVLILLVISLFIMFIFAFIERRRATAYKQTETDRSDAVLEVINGFETVIAYNQQQKLSDKYLEITPKHRKMRRKFFRIHLLFSPLIELIWNIGTLSILILGFYLISNNQTQLGVLVSFLSYMSWLLAPLLNFGDSYNSSAKMSGIADQVCKIFIQNARKIQDTIESISGYDISFSKVFSHNTGKSEGIKNVSLCINENEKVRVRGNYGSGKTAFVNVLLRLYNIKTGSVKIGDVEIDLLERQILAQTIGLLSDDVSIFDMTIWDNIKMARQDASDKEIKSAITKAGLNKLVLSLQNKELTKISNATVSAGDKQLIGLARLIVQNPKIIVLDEATRHLDQRNKARFFKTITAFCKNKTLIFVSSTDKPNIKFDKTIVFESGKVANILEKH